MARGSGYKQPGDWKTTRARILRRDGNVCQVNDCQERATSVDHVVSVAAGGSHDDENLVAICWPHKQIKDEADRMVGWLNRKPRAITKRAPEKHPGAIRA